MDVTLYGITYDKYDNEVYIPIMYFDTLKVSSIEQTADQVSARGGLGNAEHVNWQFGKQLTLKIEDALYTPSSQSLIWGGHYGLKPIKVKGFWIPAYYETDQYGNNIYFERVVSEEPPKEDGTTIDTDWICFECPCDNKYKYMTYEPIVKEPEIIEGTIAWRDDSSKQIYIKGNELIIYTEKDVPNNARVAELLIDKFDDFTTQIFDIENNGERINTELNPEQDIDITKHTLLEYCWHSSVGQMVTTTVNKEQAYDDDIDFCIHSHIDNNNKRYIFYDRENDKYNSYYNFYMTIQKELQGLEVELDDGTLIKKPIKKIIQFKVFLGTFYIVEDWNVSNTSEESGVNLINSGLKEIKQIENLRSYSAKQMFAIDVDKNILSYNLLKNNKYSQSNLAVYIDPNTMMPYEANAHYYDCADGTRIWGNLRIFKQDENYLLWKRRENSTQEAFLQTVVRAQDYPGVFKIKGETFIRNRFGEDQLYQIEIPLCQLGSNINLNLQASGEPNTVNMEFKVLRQVDGTFAKLTLYHEEEKCECKKPLTIPIIPEDKKVIEAVILYPLENDIYCLAKDCRISNEAYEADSQNYTYFRLPKNSVEAAQLKAEFDEDRETFARNHKEILLIQKKINNHLTDYIYTQNDRCTIQLSFNDGSDA